MRSKATSLMVCLNLSTMSSHTSYVALSCLVGVVLEPYVESCELQASHGEQCGVIRVVVGGQTIYVALPDGGQGWSSVQ